MTTRIRLRRDLAATWTSVNPVLLDAEPGYETDTGKMKIGDGSTTWANLAYADNRLNGAITANLLPLTSNVYSFGSVTKQWKNAWIDGAYLGAGDAFTTVTNGNLTVNGANVAAEVYVVNLNSAMSARVNAANAAIITANTALKNYTDDRFTALVNGAPAVMDTLFEISQSLGNSASFSTTMVNWMANTNANIIAANAATVTANINLKNYTDGLVDRTNGNIKFTDTTIGLKPGATDNIIIATSAYQWKFAANGATLIPGSLLAGEVSVLTSTTDINLTAADDVNIVAQGKNVNVSANDAVEINGGDRTLPVATAGGAVNISAGDGGSNPGNYDGGAGGTVTITGGAGGLVASAITVNSATQASPVQIVTAVNHGNPDKVLIAGAAGMTGLNGSWYATAVNGTTLNLYTNEAKTIPLNGSGFPAYTGSGTLTARRAGGSIALTPNPGSTSSPAGKILVNGTLQFQDGTTQATAIPIAPVYANSTARDAAIPSPVAGMMVVTNGTFQGYDGLAWVNLS